MGEVRFMTREELNQMNIKRLDRDSNTWLFWNNEEILFVIRTGFCDYKKCKNKCCKFCEIPYNHEYWEGFGNVSKITDRIILNKRCKFLKKNGSCSKWGVKNTCEKNLKNGISSVKGFPRACREFPLPKDTVYHEVFDVCSFKFKVLHSVKRLSENVRCQTVEEMIKCFDMQDD